MPKRVLALLFILISSAVGFADDCQKIVASSTETMREYLGRVDKTSEPYCLERVIVRLGDSRDAEAVAVLIKFLDFRRPPTEREKAGVAVMRDPFPAVGALFSIGDSAIPALLGAIRSVDLNDLSRKNAVRSVMLIYRENPPQGVAALRKAARETKVPAEATRLETSAKDAVTMCIPDWRERCESAIAKPDN